EYDTEDAEVQRMPDGSFLVDGGISIGDLDDLLDAELPDDDFDTLGGLILDGLEHIPAEGEFVEAQGWRFTVTEMEGRRIKRVMVAPAEPDSEPVDDTPAE
ncbi:MAG: transporter associated domain-containing protein, partial [Ilumatobacteraceae bacterium]